MAARRMRIQLNGESYELPDGETVAALLARLDMVGRRVAVELNLISSRAVSTPKPPCVKVIRSKWYTPSAVASPASGPAP